MPNHDSPQQELQDELSAYLDGELDAEAVGRVEARLARDAVYRGELNRLERAWNLLDRLPRASVDENFTKTTIEMVALSASQEAESIARELPRRRRRGRMLAAISMAGALVVGFLIGTQLWPDPNEQLLADLPVLENLDLYYQADEIEFLRLLGDKGLFHDSDADDAADGSLLPSSTTAAAAATATNTLTARRQQLARMEPGRQQELLRKYERFAAMPAEEQQQLRALEAEIRADRNSQRLHLALESYHEWLKTITPNERASLADLDPRQRVEAVERIQRRQRADEKLELLSGQDRRTIRGWIYGLVKQHRDDILASMSPDDRRKFDNVDDATQRRWLVYRTFRGRGKNGHGSRVTQQDIDRLAGKLSQPGRTELAAADTPEKQRHIVGTWVYATMNRSGSWRGGRMNSLVGEELFQFLQNEVTPARREELLKMPREQMLHELRRMYFEQSRGSGGFRGPGPRGRRQRGSGPRPGDKSPPGKPPRKGPPRS